MLLRFQLLLSIFLVLAMSLVQAQDAELEVVGVLGNTSGMSDRPVPYAFYTGIALDARGRLYLAGATEGVTVCDQDGECLTVLPLPKVDGLTANSFMVRAGDAIFCVATNPNAGRSALFRIDAKPADANELKVEQVTAGLGIWALSPTLTPDGKLVIGQSRTNELKYSVISCDPISGEVTTLFTLDQPKGATRPWLHFIQVEPDGTMSIQHSGGNNWKGRYAMKGERLGEALGGQIIDNLRYHFGYEGGVRRMDITDTKPAPGDCGSGVAEIRMAAQMVRDGERYFFAGRGGMVEAKWTGTNFEYIRRIGAIYVEDMIDGADALHGIAYFTLGSNDVQHPINFPKEQPIGQLLKVDGPAHSKNILSLAPAPYGSVIVYRTGKGFMVGYNGSARHLDFDVELPLVQSIGQSAVQLNDLLLADPKAGTIWHRPLMDKVAPMTVWRVDLPGVTGLAVNNDGVFVATPTTVSALSPDGKQIVWSSAEKYTGIRRLAATADHVYICDTAGQIVDQLDARTGKRLARLGTPGETGATLTRLNRPYAIAADVNGVYIADNGNGRVLVATTTLWRPEINRLPREETTPIVAVTIPIKPPVPGRMSLNIFDANDLTVRQLISAQPSTDKVTWDGRNLFEKWATPGTYRYNGIIAPKFSLRYIGSIGQSGTPPYRTADGKGSWGGVWGYVMDVCPVTADPESDIIVLWAFEEGEGGLIRMSQDGEVRWKQHLSWWMKANQTAVTCDGTSVYIACESAMNAPAGQSNYGGDWRRPMLWRVDAATGKTTYYSSEQDKQPMYGDYTEAAHVVTDLMVHDGKLYLTSPALNTLFVIESATGKELAAWKIDGISGVAIDAHEQLFAGSGQKIIEVAADGTVGRTVADVKGDIWDIDVTKNGFVVSTWAPRHQVIFLDATGKEVRKLGKMGGRPLCGAMQAESFLQPVGLCVMGNGKILVAESAAPKRFTRWSTDGKLEKEFNGPYYYSGMFGIDEAIPEYVYGDTHGDIIRYKFNYTTGDWKVDHYWINAYKDSGVPAKWWPRVRYKDGHTYWCSGSGGIVELLNDRVHGVAAVYGGWVEKQTDGNYLPTDWKKKTGLKGTWSDLNGDGKQQPEEWQVTDKPTYPVSAGGPQQGWGGYFDEKFDFYMHDWSDDATGGVWRIPVSEWRNGVPIYRWDKAEHAGLPLGNGLAHGASGARTAFAAGGATYAMNGGYNAANLPGVGHGHDYEFVQLTKYDGLTGKPLWYAGERSPGFAAPGQQYCPTGPAGVVNGYLFWTDENSLVHAWDVEHGLYVDTLLDDPTRDPTPSPYTVWVELFNTRVFTHPKTGKVYLMAASDAIHIYEVLGTEKKAVPFKGEFNLTAADIQSAKDQLSRRTPATERSLAIKHAPADMKIDGDLGEFATASVATMAVKENAQGTARLLYDDKNLYAAFDVKDDSPWKNAGGDVTALFKTGDEVSIWTGPTLGNRQPGIGDTRILIAPGADNDKTIVMAYRAKVATGAKRVNFRSPSGDLWMDKVEQLTDVSLVVKVNEHGYTLEAAIPWSELGMTPKSERFGLDLSINFSDPAGQRNVARMHWARNGGANVYDLPSEASIEPGTWGWGLIK